MGNHRTTSLHKALPVDIREQVDEAFRLRPPGLAAVDDVIAKFDLINKYRLADSTIRRYAKHIRDDYEKAKNKAIHAKLRTLELVKAQIDKTLELDRSAAKLLFLQVVDAASVDDLSPKEINLLAAALKSVQTSEEKRHQIAAIVKTAETSSKQDPERALADMIYDVRSMYGLGNE